MARDKSLFSSCGIGEQSALWDIGAAVSGANDATERSDEGGVLGEADIEADIMFSDVGDAPDSTKVSNEAPPNLEPVLGGGWVSLPGGQSSAKAAQPAAQPAAQRRSVASQVEPQQIAQAGGTHSTEEKSEVPRPHLPPTPARFPVQLYDRSKMCAWSIRRALAKGTQLPVFFIQICTKHTGAAADWQNKEHTHSFSMSLTETIRLSAFLLNPERVEVIFSYHDHKNLRLTRANGAIFFALQYRSGGSSLSSQIHAPPEHQFLLIAMARQLIAELKQHLWPDVDIRQIYADLARTV